MKKLTGNEKKKTKYREKCKRVIKYNTHTHTQTKKKEHDDVNGRAVCLLCCSSIELNEASAAYTLVGIDFSFAIDTQQSINSIYLKLVMVFRNEK